MNLPNGMKNLPSMIVYDLKQTNGIKAIVVGGSHTTGLATTSSDLDIGIYYSESNPFEINTIKNIVS